MTIPAGGFAPLLSSDNACLPPLIGRALGVVRVNRARNDNEALAHNAELKERGH